MSSIETKYGNLEGAVFRAAYPDGYPREIRLERENRLVTNYGVFVPHYSSERLARRFESDIMLYPDGGLKYIAFLDRTSLPTNYGMISCISAMFYEDGGLKHLFIEDMKEVAGFGDDVESDLVDNIKITLESGHIKAKISGISFYPDGTVCNISFPPDEEVELNTPEGAVKIKNGMYFHENGAIKSLEPATPVCVDTPIGELTAWHPDVAHNCGKNNSLVFNIDGEVESLKTACNVITAMTHEEEYIFRPARRPDEYFEEIYNFTSVSLCFEPGKAIVLEPDGTRYELDLNDFVFDIYSLVTNPRRNVLT